MQKPDFDSYSEAQLRQALSRIDAARFPERVQEIEARLAALARQPAVPQAEAPQNAALAGFWRRLFAFVLDMLVLGVIGFLLSVMFANQFVAMGPWGRAVGFLVALIYFGGLESQAGGGRSLGKRVLGLRVVRRDGTPLHMPAAAIRTAIFCLAYFLNGASLLAMTGHAWLMSATAFLLGTLIISVFYLLAFNRRTRQSIHDLAVGAFVIRNGAGPFAPPEQPVWRGHAAIVGIAIMVICAGGFFLVERTAMGALLAVQREVGAVPDISGVGVSVNVVWSKQATVHRMVINGIIDRALGDPDALAARVANIALDTYADAQNQQQIVVTLASGYDIGIASNWHWVSYVWSPEQWRALAAGKMPEPSTQRSM